MAGSDFYNPEIPFAAWLLLFAALNTKVVDVSSGRNTKMQSLALVVKICFKVK